MKNIRLTILFVLLSIYSVNAQINDTITFSLADLKIDTIGDYLKPSMLDCSYTDIIGYPELPRLEVRYVTETSLNEAMGFTVSVSPNPATTWTMVAYTLPVDATKATFNLTNALGVTVANYDLPGDETQKVIDLRGLADGFYLYTVQCGKHVYTGKLVVTK